MTRSQSGGLASRRTIDRHDLHAHGRKCSVDLLGTAGSQRPDDDLGVDARGDQQTIPVTLGSAKQPPGSGVMGIVSVEEADQHVGVEGYRSHSSRSRWR